MELTDCDDHMTYFSGQHGWWLAPAWHIVKALLVSATIIFYTVTFPTASGPESGLLLPMLCSVSSLS